MCLLYIWAVTVRHILLLVTATFTYVSVLYVNCAIYSNLQLLMHYGRAVELGWIRFDNTDNLNCSVELVIVTKTPQRCVIRCVFFACEIFSNYIVLHSHLYESMKIRPVINSFKCWCLWLISSAWWRHDQQMEACSRVNRLFDDKVYRNRALSDLVLQVHMSLTNCDSF